MVVVLSTLALLTTGIKAATWTWFGYKTINVAFKMGESLILSSNKSRKPMPKFQSGRVEKFYKGVSRQAMPRISRKNEKLAERMKEAIKEGENITLIPSFHDTTKSNVSKRQGPIEIKKETEEDKMINSMVMKNFSGCKNDCDCSNGSMDGSRATPASSAEDPSKYSAAIIAENTVKELQTMWEQSQEDCDIVLETPVKNTKVKSQNTGNLFEKSIFANKYDDADFETLRNSTPATFPGKKCDFELSFKFPCHPKLQSSKSKIKNLHALQLLEESQESFNSECETQISEELEKISNKNPCSEANEGISGDDSSTFPDASSSSQSPVLRKPRGDKRKQKFAEKDFRKDFSDIVYKKMVTSAKRKLSVSMVDVLDVYENAKEVADFLKDGGSISSKEVTLKLTPKHEGFVASDGPSETIIQDQSEVGDYSDPLPVWTPTAKSVIPSWNKDLLPSEALPQSVETPPTPPRVDISLLACMENFDNEESKPAAAEEIFLEKNDLNDVLDISDTEEVVVNYNNFCLIRTTPAAIKKARKSEERNQIMATGVGSNKVSTEDDVDDSFCFAIGEKDLDPTNLMDKEQLLGDPAILEENVETSSTTSGIYEDSTITEKMDATVKELGVEKSMETGADTIFTADKDETDLETEADIETSNIRLSLGVSYDLFNAIRTKDDSPTNGSQADSTDTTVTFKEAFDGTTIMYESINNDTYDNTTKQVAEIENRSEEIPCDLEEDKDDIVLVAVEGNATFINHTLSTKNIKKEIKDEEEINTDQSEEDEDQEVIIISDDEGPTLPPTAKASTAVSNLERSIVTDLQLQMNGQFEVEEIDE